MVSKKKKSITEKYSLILKIIGFSMLAIAGYMDLTNSNNTILTDPFALGATLNQKKVPNFALPKVIDAYLS